MKKSEEDIKLDKIGKLLELGGTMLANHCDCGAPLFRYHGNVICPICDSNQVEKKEETSDKNTHSNEDQQSSGTSQSFIKVPQPFTEARQITGQPKEVSLSISPETYEFISNTIINKVVQLCLDLQRETDLGRIKQQMETIESGTRTLRSLR